MKICTKCKSEKPHDEYSKQAAKYDGLRSQCKKCDKDDKLIYRQNPCNAAKIKQYKKDKREEQKQAKESEKTMMSPEEINAIETERNIRNKEKYRRYYKKNKQAAKEYYTERKEHKLQLQRDYRNTNAKEITRKRIEYERKNREKLGERYVLRTITQHRKIPANRIPNSLVELQRIQLKIKRELKRINDEKR